MKIFSVSEFSIKAVATFKRFPACLLWVITSALCSLWLVEDGGADNLLENHLNFILTSVLGVSWLIATQFYIEQFKKKTLWWIKIIMIILLISFYFTLPENIDSNDQVPTTPYLRWGLYMVAGHLTLFFVPFLTVWHPKAYWNYLSNMIIAISRSALFSGVFYLGIMFALLAIEYLFDTRITSKRYFQLFIICLGIINTWVYLADFSKDIQHNIHLHFSKPLEVFVKFILIPLAGLYMLILYAYALKICLQWELPKGSVSYLTIALAMLLFLIQLIIHPVRISHPSMLFKKFQPLAYWLLLPLLILFYVGIYRRISEYGFTEARYFLVIIAVFITGAAAYLIFSRKQQLRYLPIALAIFTLACSFGYWGAFSVSIRSQSQEFEALYTSFKKEKKGNAPDLDAFKRFRSVTKYLYDREAHSEITSVIGYSPKTAYPDENIWSLPAKILDSLGLATATTRKEKSNLYFNLREREARFIKGYEWSDNFYFGSGNVDHFIAHGYRVGLSPSGQSFYVQKDDQIVLRIPIKKFISQLQEKDSQTTKTLQKRMQLEGFNESIDIKFYFDNISLREDNNALVISFAGGTVLLNIKE